MNRLLTLIIVTAIFCPLAAFSVTPSKTIAYADQGVSLSLLDPIGSVYQEGEEVGFSVRTQSDAYVLVFDIDTEGFVHLLYPLDARNFQKFSSDRVYYLPDEPGASLRVGGPKGLEFVFALAVKDLRAINEEEVSFLARNESLPLDRRFRITGDPFEGANRIIGQLVRGAQRENVTISFTYFYVGEAVDYPRYLCEDCYEKGKDPYASGMPAYVASADFQATAGLTYPLAPGFVSEYAAESGSGWTENQSSVTKVYVSYYPRWDTGYYSTTWWYLDPWYAWYWDPWYAPYSGFYFSVGWNWGWPYWGAFHYRYFPYYYCGPYYAYRPYWGYYSCYPDHYYYGYGSWYPYYPYYGPHSGSTWRTYGVVHKGNSLRSTTLHSAMNQRFNRDVGLAQRSLKSDAYERRAASTSSLERRAASGKLYDGERTLRTLQKERTDPRVIRGTGVKRQSDLRSPLRKDSRDVRSGKSYREQRVITRGTHSERTILKDRTRGTGTRALDGAKREVQRKFDSSPSPRTKVAPNAPTRKSEPRGTYKPNVRRNTGGSSTPPRVKSGSSGRSSTSSKATSSSRSGSSGSSKGGSRGKR